MEGIIYNGDSKKKCDRHLMIEQQFETNTQFIAISFEMNVV